MIHTARTVLALYIGNMIIPHDKKALVSQPLFDVHRQHLYTFLIDLPAEVSMFRYRIFHCFAYFLKL